VIYWQHFTPEQYAPKLAQIRLEEAAAIALDQSTVDRVTPGEQQPEADHNFQSDRSNAGYFQDRHWRDAKGWFGYDLKTIPNQPLSLAVTYWSGDNRRSFSILANETKIADVALQGKKPGSFETVIYPIPAAQASSEKLTIKFVAEPGSTAGGVFDVRLIKSAK